MHVYRGQQGSSIEPDGFSEKILILDYRGLSSQKVFFFLLFWPSSKTTQRIFPIFCRTAQDNRVHSLSQMLFLKEVLIADYNVVSVCYLRFQGFFYKSALRMLPIFCIIVEDNRVHRLSQIAFLKSSITEYCGIFNFQGIQLFLQKSSKDLPNFCFIVQGNGAHCLSQTAFLKR